MASIFGHALAGAIANQSVTEERSGKKARWLLLLSVLLALLPDLDVVVYILFEPADMTPHRGITHGIPFILLTSSILALSTGRVFEMPTGRLFLVYALALASHPLMDILMGAGPRVPLFAPFSDVAFLSPVTLIPWSYYSTELETLVQVLFYPPAIRGFLLEMMILIPLFIISRRRQSRHNGAGLLLITAIGLLTTVIVYN